MIVTIIIIIVVIIIIIIATTITTTIATTESFVLLFLFSEISVHFVRSFVFDMELTIVHAYTQSFVSVSTVLTTSWIWVHSAGTAYQPRHILLCTVRVICLYFGRTSLLLFGFR